MVLIFIFAHIVSSSLMLVIFQQQQQKYKKKTYLWKFHQIREFSFKLSEAPGHAMLSRSLQAKVFRLGFQVGQIQVIKITRTHLIDLNWLNKV